MKVENIEMITREFKLSEVEVRAIVSDLKKIGEMQKYSSDLIELFEEEKEVEIEIEKETIDDENEDENNS